jgi:hypothetical protein
MTESRRSHQAERLRCMVAGGFQGRTGPVIVIIAMAISRQA